MLFFPFFGDLGKLCPGNQPVFFCRFSLTRLGFPRKLQVVQADSPWDLHPRRKNFKQSVPTAKPFFGCNH